jgi:hypothetical protein
MSAAPCAATSAATCAAAAAAACANAACAIATASNELISGAKYFHVPRGVRACAVVSAASTRGTTKSAAAMPTPPTGSPA